LAAIKTIFQDNTSNNFNTLILTHLNLMIQAKNLLTKYLFLTLFLVFQITGWLAFIVIGRDDLFLLINGFSSGIVDDIFFAATLIGEWPQIVFVLLYIALYKREQILKVILAFSCLAITAFSLKNFVFSNHPRPATYFNSIINEIYFSQYLEMGYWQSFPSGHTFTAFTGLAFLAFTSNKRWVHLTCFLLATLAGVSRIYNGMHFPEDVLTGSLLGVLFSFIIYTFVPALGTKNKN